MSSCPNCGNKITKDRRSGLRKCSRHGPLQLQKASARQALSQTGAARG